MYARVITIQAQPAKLEEMVCFFERCILPAGEQQPGFEGYLLLTEEQAGKAISIALWRTKSEMNAFDSACLARLTDELTAFLDAPPTVEIHDVRLRAEALPAQPGFFFGETSLGIRIQNPCDDKLNQMSA